MKKTKNDDNRSETMSIRYNNASQISTPRLTPLKMLDRNRNQLVSQDDIDKLEFKIKEIEDQIFAAKKKGEDKKIDKLETQLKKTEHQHISLLLNEDQPPVNAFKVPSPEEKEEVEDSDFEIEIDYDCSSLTLEQSMKQVFNISNSVKIPSIEKQQLASLQSHIFKLMIDQNEVQGRRSIKQQRKSIVQMRGVFSTAQKAAN